MFWFPTNFPVDGYSMRGDLLNELGSAVVRRASNLRHYNFGALAFSTRDLYENGYVLRIFRLRRTVNHSTFANNANGNAEVAPGRPSNHTVSNTSTAWQDVDDMDTGEIILTGRTCRVIMGCQIDGGAFTTSANYHAILAGVEVALDHNGQIYGESQEGTPDINNDRYGYSTLEDHRKYETQIVFPISPGRHRFKMRTKLPRIPEMIPTSSQVFYQLNNRYIYILDCK